MACERHLRLIRISLFSPLLSPSRSVPNKDRSIGENVAARQTRLLHGGMRVVYVRNCGRGRGGVSRGE